MNQMTEFGKEVRKIRIDREMSLKQMADTLGVPSSYLSAVEKGRRKLTQEFVERVIDALRPNLGEELAIRDAAVESMEAIPLNISSMGSEAKKTAAVFARRLNSMSPEELERMREIMER